MEVALITVGDELLSGDTVNTNANWLAARLSERGVTVVRSLSVPDDRATIADRVAAYGDAFDAVIVTGGIGGTPDDVTMEAVADAFGRGMAPTEATRAAVERRLAELETELPDLDVDVDSEAAIPEGGRMIVNDPGLAPGAVVENAYVLPGIPEELKATFRTVADEFAGDARSAFLYTVAPESNIVPALETVMERFDVAVGCYPDREAGHNRLKVTGTDDATIDAACDWLLETISASETPVSRDWADGDADAAVVDDGARDAPADRGRDAD